METIYDIHYFIRKFEAIPEKNYCTDTFMFGCKRCFIGHTLTTEMIYKIWDTGFYIDEFAETKALCLLICPSSAKEGCKIAYSINNKNHPDFQQPTPKQRILAALYQIRDKQQPEVKERIVYVSIDQEVKELTQELTLN